MMHGVLHSHAIAGVLYAEDFDEPLARSVPTKLEIVREPEIIAPGFTLAELRAATQQAHEEGQASARMEAAALSATQRAVMLASLVEQITATQAQAEKIIEQALDALACTSLSLLAAALPALCASHAEGELRAVLRRVLPPTRQLPELHIRIHPSMRDAIEDEAHTLMEGSGIRITWTDADKLSPGDIAIAWRNGGALRDTGAVCSAINQAVIALFEKTQPTKMPDTEMEMHDGQ